MQTVKSQAFNTARPEARWCACRLKAERCSPYSISIEERGESFSRWAEHAGYQNQFVWHIVKVDNLSINVFDNSAQAQGLRFSAPRTSPAFLLTSLGLPARSERSCGLTARRCPTVCLLYWPAIVAVARVRAYAPTMDAPVVYFRVGL